MTQQQLLQFISDECSSIMLASRRLRTLLQEIRHVHELANDWTGSSEQVYLARSRGELLDYNEGLIQQDEVLLTDIGLEAAILPKQEQLRFLDLQPDDLRTYLQSCADLTPSQIDLTMEVADKGHSGGQRNTSRCITVIRSNPA